MLHGGAGNDFILWKAGDGSDTADGDGDSDTFAADGSAGADTFGILANGPRFGLQGPGATLNDVGSTERLEVRGLGGNDTVTGTNGIPATGLTAIDTDGGPGNDTLGGTDLGETIRGGDGNDTVDPNRGDDKAFLGAGNDTVQWDPGDGNDTVEGDAGTDRLLFNASNAGENIDLSAVGKKLRFFRDVAAVTMTLGGVERADYNAFGGADTLVVNDLSATPVKHVYGNLAATGGAVGDGAADDVQVFGTTGANTVAVSPSSTTVNVAGLGAAVHITTAEAANDDLLVFGLAGADKLSASSGLAALIGLTLERRSRSRHDHRRRRPRSPPGRHRERHDPRRRWQRLDHRRPGRRFAERPGRRRTTTRASRPATRSCRTAPTRSARSVPDRADGGGGIRTHGTLSRPTVFKTAPFGRSGTPPRASLVPRRRARCGPGRRTDEPRAPTAPPSSWKFSRIASIAASVTAVPFSVCSVSSAALAAVADAEPARLEVGRVRGRRDLAVALLGREPRLDVVLLRRRRAEVARGDVDDAVGEAELARRAPPRSRAAARARRASPPGAQKTNISTLSNWWTRNMPRVSLPAAPASRRKHVEKPA